ncbi:MAG: pentapeptide repeat-containing protein [Bacteroidia bacterium]
MDTPEIDNPLGIRVPVPQMELRMIKDHGEEGHYLKGTIHVTAGLESFDVEGFDLHLVLQVPDTTVAATNSWQPTGFWSQYKAEYAYLDPRESKEFSFTFDVPEVALPPRPPYRHFLSVTLRTYAQLHLRAETEVCIYENLDNAAEDYTSMAVNTGAGRGHRYPTLGDKLFRPHELADYLLRFDAMVKALRESTVAVVLDYHTFSPLRDADIAEVETKIGFHLPEALRAFYQQTNGLQLRWIRKDNPQYDPERDRPQSTPLFWDWQPANEDREDGLVFLLPLERLMDDGGAAEAAVSQPHHPRFAIRYLDQKINSIDFQKRLRIFDRFSVQRSAILMLGDPAISSLHLGQLGQVSTGASCIVDVGTYLEFLIARLGWVGKRKEFMLPELSKVPTYYYGAKVYWEWQAMEPVTMELAEAFPQCTVLPRACEFNKEWFRLKNAELSDQLVQARWRQMEAHRAWVESGGWVTGWIRFMAHGRPWIMTLTGHDRDGNMVESLGRLDGYSWRGANLPFLGYSAMDARGVDAVAADLRYGLFIHTNFEGADFTGANLRFVDFTGCNLRNANFHGADIAGADFEIADLRGADFTGSNPEYARFPGARLHGVKRDTVHPFPQSVPKRSADATILLLLNDLKPIT